MNEQAVFDALRYRVVVDCHGNRLYYNNAGWLHRTDGPAVERNDGYREWWINGVELPVYQDDLNITPQFILSKHIYDSIA